MDAMECAVRKLLRGTGEVPERAGLRDTPKVRECARQERSQWQGRRGRRSMAKDDDATAAAMASLRHGQALHFGRPGRVHTAERSRDPFRREKREHSRSCRTKWDGSADVDASRPVMQRVARALVFAGKGYEDTAKRYAVRWCHQLSVGPTSTSTGSRRVETGVERRTRKGRWKEGPYRNGD